MRLSKTLSLSLSTLLILSCSPKAKESMKASSKGLKQGQTAPQIDQNDIDDNTFNLTTSLQDGPVVLVFYRGGWCPYCSLQLRNLQAKALPALKKSGAKLIAISVDKADKALATKQKESLGMTILSDPEAKLLKAYDVAFKVPDELVATYIKKYKIDLEGASGQKHHLIAIPAVYVIDQKGKITFSYVNEDYKVRAQIKDILAAVSKLY